MESNSFVASPTRDATSYQRARDIDDPLRSLVTVAWTLDNLHSFSFLNQSIEILKANLSANAPSTTVFSRNRADNYRHGIFVRNTTVHRAA